MKRGQTTIFVILGIVIITLIIIFFFVAKKPSLQPQDPSTVKEFVESCLKTTLQKAVEKNGKTGSLEEINKFIRQNLPNCLDFSSFKKLNIGVTDIEAVTTSITSSQATTTIMMPLTITQAANKITYSEFSSSIPLKCSACIPIKVDSSCTAIEQKYFSACGLSKQYSIGNSLMINGECIAC